MDYKLFAFLGMFCNSINDFVFRIVASGREQSRYRNLFYTLQAASVFVLCTIYMIVFKVRLETEFIYIAYGILLGLTSYISYMLLLKSLEYGDASKNVTIYRMNFVIVSILAVIFLNEELTVKKLLGILLLIASIVFFSIKSHQPFYVKNTGAKYSIAGCFMAGILNLITKIALNEAINEFTLIFYRFFIVFIIALCTVIYKKGPYLPSRKLGILSGISGSILFISISLLYVALKSGDVVVIAPISQMSFIFTALMSFVFLKELLNLNKVIGICLCVLCIFIIV